MKPYAPMLVILLLVSSSYVGVSNTAIELEEDMEQPIQASSPPMDSPWPMKCHDVRHTGRSPYSTADNRGVEKWRFRSEWDGGVESSAVIDDDGIIYFGTMGTDCTLYALFPNGTKKWKYPMGTIWSTPAIAEDGTIYIGEWGGYRRFHAIYPNGTRKWIFEPGDSISSSPAIGDDGTIYFGCGNKKIFAINSNGTKKWHYTTGYIVISDPAIGDDGTIYIGSGDNYLYALYPNGTLRWRFKTGGDIKGHPSIAEDGTIYIPSFDGYLYALYQNGTMKWKVGTGPSILAASAAIASDGTLYVGTEKLRAFYPNGTLKWSVDLGGDIYGTSPAVSADGTIYVSAGKSLVAVNPDGTEKWRKQVCDVHARSSPCIGEDGTIYVGSTSENPKNYRWYGHLHAFGEAELRADAGGPYGGETLGKIKFTGMAFGGIPPYIYHWDFGDGNVSDEQNPIHIYYDYGVFNATLTVTDSEGNKSSDYAIVTIRIGPPKVWILKPGPALYLFNQRIFGGWWMPPIIIGSINIKAEALQSPYGIDYVEFYIDDKLKKTDTKEPFTWRWRRGSIQIHNRIITVIAYDKSGNYSSDKIKVWRYF